ncbi:MAG TPA: hypothetical protein DDW50_20535 [Firmicutes bacterium]|jgi:hypothetical protein|nr:hypothetical protein [Bacillota bacterium]
MQNTSKVDRRIIKSREAIRKSFLELFTEKRFAQLQLMIFRKEQMLTGELFIYTIMPYTICWIPVSKNM